MERKTMKFSVLFWVLSVSHFSLVASRNPAEVEDQKNVYSPDPSAWSPPSHYHNSPSCQTPPAASSGTTPSHGVGIHYPPPPTPSHGGGIHYPPPPTPSQGGGIHYSPPPTPSHGGPGGGGSGGSSCNCNTPPSSTPPVLPLNPPSRTTPIPQAPPTPLVPLNPPPSSINPSPPLVPDPNTPPFPCNYWFTHPTAVWVLFGYWGTVGQIFGTPPATGFTFGRNLSILEALGNNRDDGYGALLREGTASLLNSMASKSFDFSTQQVRDGFNTAIRSEKMSASQAKIFQKANEGHLKH